MRPADNRGQIAVKVFVNDSASLDQLVDDLARGGCVPRTVDDETVEVVHPDASTPDEARTELMFFLRAWQTRHPQVDVRLG
jgi:hypothetical protein